MCRFPNSGYSPQSLSFRIYHSLFSRNSLLTFRVNGSTAPSKWCCWHWGSHRQDDVFVLWWCGTYVVQWCSGVLVIDAWYGIAWVPHFSWELVDTLLIAGSGGFGMLSLYFDICCSWVPHNHLWPLTHDIGFAKTQVTALKLIETFHHQ